MPTRVVKTTTVTRTTHNTNTIRNYGIWPVAVLLACIALLLAIISIAASGWYGMSLMKNCNGCLGTTVLSFLGIFFLLLGIISTILFAKRLITSFSVTIKISAVILLTLAGIFIIIAYTTFIGYNVTNYCYYLMAISAVFTFLSSILMAFWLGLHWITL